jgi:hypothetical protein
VKRLNPTHLEPEEARVLVVGEHAVRGVEDLPHRQLEELLLHAALVHALLAHEMHLPRALQQLSRSRHEGQEEQAAEQGGRVGRWRWGGADVLKRQQVGCPRSDIPSWESVHPRSGTIHPLTGRRRMRGSS